MENFRTFKTIRYFCLKRQSALKELAELFLKLGTISFGGPAAHISMMEDEVVRRRKWLTHQEFLDLVGVTSLIPGPNSTEMAIHIGHKRAGFLGLIVAGICFIMPAVLIVSVIAWAYVEFGNLPEVTGILYGVKPIIIAIVLQALWGLSRSAVKSKQLAVVAMILVILGAIGMNELLLLLGAGISVAFIQNFRLQKKSRIIILSLVTLFTSVSVRCLLAASTSVAKPVDLKALFFIFFKIGSVLYGSGYVLLVFLRNDLVERMHWLTESQLLDATAIGQFTPGPVFTTATFIGYVLNGPWGAALATIAIFFPAFFFVAISGPLVPKLRRSPIAGAFLDGVNLASLALMAVVTWDLARSAIMDWITLGLALVGVFLLMKFRVNSAWLILTGAFAGLLKLSLIR